MSSPSDKPVLYSYFRSSCSARVRVALHLKGIEFEQRPVNLLLGEHKKDAYRALSASGLVPLLIIDGHTLSQSPSILEYLEETRPEPALLPADPYARAQVRRLCDIIGADIQPLQNARVQGYIGDEKKAEWARHWITLGFQTLERELSQTAGRYCFGDQLTLADLYLPPQVYGAQRVGVDLSAFPIIQRIDATLNALPAFRRGHFSRQPDCPPELRAQD